MTEIKRIIVKESELVNKLGVMNPKEAELTIGVMKEVIIEDKFNEGLGHPDILELIGEKNRGKPIEPKLLLDYLLKNQVLIRGKKSGTYCVLGLYYKLI